MVKELFTSARQLVFGQGDRVVAAEIGFMSSLVASSLQNTLLELQRGEDYLNLIYLRSQWKIGSVVRRPREAVA